MNIKKIYFFIPVTNQYGVIDYFAQELANALSQLGVEIKFLRSVKNNPAAFVNQILDDPPDCTFCFNGLLPDLQGRFLSDMINIPHVAFLTDAPKHFFPMVKSKNTILTCVDEDFCQTFKMMGFSRVFYLPHAAGKGLKPLERPQFEYEVLMLNSYIDYNAYRNQWKQAYGSAISAVLDEAAEWVLSDRDISYMEAFSQTMDKHLKMGKTINPMQLNYIELLEYLETYIGGKSRMDLLLSIKDVRVDVFGAKKGSPSWQKYLGPQHSNVHIHERVPFLQALDLMKRAKILLHAVPEFKRGLHERVVCGPACGAAVLSLETNGLAKIFKDKDDILFYKSGAWNEVNDKIQDYLGDEEKRQTLVTKARENVMTHHTWNNRAKTILEQLPLLLEELKQ